MAMRRFTAAFLQNQQKQHHAALLTRQVAARASIGSSSSAFAATPVRRQASGSSEVDEEKISMGSLWGLWNEGNLFSLNQAELVAILAREDPSADTKGQKKAVLVRKVEELMAKQSPPQINKDAKDDTVKDITDAQANVRSAEDAVSDLYDETDVYGDWGAEPGFEEKREMDFISVSLASLNAEVLEKPTASRAFQLLHQEVTTDVGLAKVNPKNLPGFGEVSAAYLPASVTTNHANRIRWRNSFKWAVTNLWNANLDGELNIGAGKALYWRGVAKEYKKTLPIWACQDHLHAAHPYSWFAVAHEDNTKDIVTFAEQLGMQQTQDAEKSYRVNIKRSRDWIDVNLNSEFRATAVNRPWDRYLVSHYLRKEMPDLRYLVRARVPIKKKVADVYFDAALVRTSGDVIQSVLSPELGDVTYCCERYIRKWAAPLKEVPGVKLHLVETKRTPLIVQRQGEEGERTEYELIINVPQQAQRVDLNKLADVLWDRGNEFAGVMETGCEQFQCYPMESAAAFFEKE